MTSIREAIRRYVTPVQPLPPGIYHYQAPPDTDKPYRLHLRLEADGSGVLIVNAATVLHLNATAAECAYHLVKGTGESETARSLSSRYRTSLGRALSDFRDFKERIQTLVETPDLDPEAYLDFERRDPYALRPSAPYRLDCALTYRLSPGVDVHAAPLERVQRELTIDEWKAMLDKAWAAGVPHVVFTGGEPTLRDDLPALIAHAESLGQVSGLLTDGLRLADADYFSELLQTGLDHVTVILDASKEPDWKTLEILAKADIHFTAHLTLTPQDAAQAPALVRRLAEIKANALSLSASDQALGEALQAARKLAAELNLALVWDLPVPYSTMHPVALETAGDHPLEGAGRAWLYIEPDGDVLPAQGVNHLLGNLLVDPWEAIWSKAGE
jgi:organic radical activating enzyme